MSKPMKKIKRKTVKSGGQRALLSKARAGRKVRKMTTTTIRQIGNSLGVILPANILALLRVNQGDKLQIVETPDGIRLSPYDEDVAEALAAAEAVGARYRNALRELAK